MSDDEIALSQSERDQNIVRCDACPVLCRIRPGRAGACDRYANEAGKLVRVDPLVLLAKPDLARVAFVEGSSSWAGELGKGQGAIVTGIGNMNWVFDLGFQIGIIAALPQRLVDRFHVAHFAEEDNLAR